MFGKWQLDIGPLAIGSEGVAIQPKFNVGYSDETVRAGVGVGDVRNGLSLNAGADVRQTFEGRGNSLSSFLRNLKAEGAGAVLNPVIDQVSWIVSKVMNLTGIDISTGKVRGSVSIEAGVGVSGKLCLGWQDTEGYNMVGAGGEVAAAAELGFAVFAGTKGQSVKLIISVSNATIIAYVN